MMMDFDTDGYMCLIQFVLSIALVIVYIPENSDYLLHLRISKVLKANQEIMKCIYYSFSAFNIYRKMRKT